jgi:PAS domain S-box-containing protein
MVEQAQAGDAGHQRYAALQAALDLIDQGFSLMDSELRLLAWNEAFIRLLGFPPEMVFEGATFESFIRCNAERGEYGPGEVQALVGQRMEAARRFEPHELERVRPNGQVLRVRGVPVPGVGFITLYSDVTAQRRAEEQAALQAAELERRVAERTSELALSEAQMRLITDSLPALIAYFDHKKAYRYINRGYQEWFGLDPARLDQISAREYLGREVYASIRPNVARAFAGEPVTYEYEAHCVDGRVRTARTTLIPEKKADGTVIGCFELTFDVSELRRAQELLSQAQKMEALGQLTGGLAHDFNNMLTVIIGNLGALRELRTDEKVTEFIDPALSAARRGAELIRALLVFARRQPLQAQAAEVGPLVSTVINLLRRSLPEGMELRLDAGELPLWAWVDASHLQDALVNLVLNSRDAQARAVVVTVSADTLSAARAQELQAQAGHYIRIAVRDDGCGMDAATRSRVFEPFFTTKRPGTGTGLGMSMVYGFVRQSVGAVALDSAPGAGTTVTLWLPVAQSAVASLLVDACCDTGHRADPSAALALLVEDDAEVRKVVRRALVDLGFAVLEAENGAEALQMLEYTPRIQLLLSDVVMPGGVDGREVARQAQARGVPRVALMSGFVPGEQPAAGEVPMLCKPFTKRQLADFLHRQVPAPGAAARTLGAPHG